MFFLEMSVRYPVTKQTILHTIAGIRVNAGGASRVVVDLTDYLSKEIGITIELLIQSGLNDDNLASISSNVSRTLAKSQSQISLILGLPFRTQLKKILSSSKVSVVHNHGLWEAPNHWAARFARRNHIPFVIQPHGTLMPWAINHKAFKKNMAMKAFQRRDLETANLFVATSLPEYESIRAIGLKQPIAVIPNGVEVMPMEVASARRTNESLKKSRTVLFLSRLHPVKGLTNLIEAWSRIENNGWKLRIVGPDVDGMFLKELLELVDRLKVGESVEFLGEANHECKSKIYRSADLFVLPTFSENFGAVVAEALAHGLPVITTKGAPWSDLETYHCGWWIEIGVESLMSALQVAMGMTDAERVLMGERGRKYVKRYDLSVISGQMLESYAWLLGNSKMPPWIKLD